MRFVLYVSKLPRNLMLLFVERVFVSPSGLVCDAPEGRVTDERILAAFKRWSKRQTIKFALPDCKTNSFSQRRHDAVKAQMLYGGLR